jgi:hypothetical protein
MKILGNKIQNAKAMLFIMYIDLLFINKQNICMVLENRWLAPQLIALTLTLTLTLTLLMILILMVALLELCYYPFTNTDPKNIPYPTYDSNPICGLYLNLTIIARYH